VVEVVVRVEGVEAEVEVELEAESRTFWRVLPIGFDADENIGPGADDVVPDGDEEELDTSLPCEGTVRAFRGRTG
jgi:hypothetical protein